MIVKTLKEMKWLAFILGRKIKNNVLSLQRFFKTPAIPTGKDGKVLLHLGCGSVNIPGFVNVDAKAAPHVHYQRDVTDLSFLPSGYADLVYACHVIEHIPVTRLKQVLWEWKRVLKIGGTLRLAVPDFDKLIAVYKDSSRDIESIRLPLMGHDDGYSSHVMVFNYEWLCSLLEELGFRNVRLWNSHDAAHHDCSDWASRPITYKGKSYAISLNVEADK